MCVFGWEWAAAQEAVNPHSQKPGQHSLTGCKDRILLPKDGRAGGDLMVVFFLSVKPFSNTILHGFPIFETDMRKAVLTKAEVGVRDIPFYAYSPRHSEAPWWKLLGSAGQ